MKSRLKKYINILVGPSSEDGHKEHMTDIPLVIASQNINLVCAGLLIFGMLNFIAGYFWGQKKAVDYFIRRIEDDSFADRISYALYTMNDRDIAEFEDLDTNDNQQSEAGNDEDDESIHGENNDTSDNASAQSDLAQDDNQDGVDTDDDLQSITPENLEQGAALVESITIEPVQEIKETNMQDGGKVYFAPVAGFGTLTAAKTFLERIKIIDNGAVVIEKISKTPKGRKIKWYQVVTGEFDDKKELDQIVRYLQSKEHIKDIKILDKRKAS